MTSSSVQMSMMRSGNKMLDSMPTTMMRPSRLARGEKKEDDEIDGARLSSPSSGPKKSAAGFTINRVTRAGSRQVRNGQSAIGAERLMI
mmetsp:Transcript_30911/g.43077  ORF Transcript_30911/g.43077 Transcript_30911/m.43077 type:complete len:89 (+) Transcript_30911:3-269(+)